MSNSVVSEGLPDEATLTQWASSLFRSLPSSAGPASEPSPASVNGIEIPGQGPDFSVTSPARPHLPNAGVPSRSRADLSSAPSGVPEAYAADLPLASSFPLSPNLLEPSPVSPLGALFYFLEENNAYLGDAPLQRPAEDRVTPRSDRLPGAEHLKGLLQGVTGTAPVEDNAHRQSDAGHFYFMAPPQAPHRAGTSRNIFDVNAIRRDFPILSEHVNGRQLVWFDNAATTQKPQSVIDRLSYFYTHENSNIHRAAHELAARATDAYEAARNKVQRFLGAGSTEEIIFVRGATEGINLIAKTWGVQNIGPGDEIIVSLLEHHANIVPWQQLVAQTGAKLRVIPVDESGQIRLDEYQRLLNGRTKLVSVTQVSNALGTVTPIKSIIDAAHAAGAKVLVDGAQSVSHMRVNVQALDADFFVFSGHKIFGPTGIGVIYGKKALLESMPAWQGGGNMIADVTFERTIFQPPPNKFEAGTGNIADAVGLGAALDYVDRVGLENIARYEHELLTYAMQALGAISGVRLIGTAQEKASVASFVLEGYAPEAVGRALNEEGIAVRSGHHCAQPILRRFGVEATVRPSFAFYNTFEEIDRMISVVKRLAQAKDHSAR